VSSESKAVRLFRRIWEIYRRSAQAPGSEHAKELAAAREELQALASENLGEDYERSRIDAIAEVKAELGLRQRELAEDLSAGRITREQYLNEFSVMVAQSAGRCEAILGRADFTKLFGVAPDKARQLPESDRSTFLAGRPG
jgi:hypothetical protein